MSVNRYIEEGDEDVVPGMSVARKTHKDRLGFHANERNISLSDTL